MNSADFLDAVRDKHGLTSDYQVAKKLEIPLSSISMYRTHRREFDDQVSMKIADALGESSLYVMASIQVERAKSSEVKAVWEYCAKIGKGIRAASVIGFVGVLGLSASVMGDLEMNVLCILCKIRRLRRALARSVGPACGILPHMGRKATILAIAALYMVSACASGNGIDRAYTPEPAVDISSPHPIKVRTRIRQSKFCAPHHAKHDHYKRCRR